MQLQQRRNFFMVFAIFFIICTPFMVLYSIGFSINFKNTEINKSLLIKADTIPRNAEMLVNNVQTITTPNEFGTTETAPVNVKIQKADFVTEDFVIAAESQQNSYVDLSNLWLLPSVNNTQSSSISSPQPKNQETKQLISENQAIVEYLAIDKLTLGIIDIGIGGQVGQVQPINSALIVGGKSIVELDLNSQIKIKLLGTDTEYKKIGNDLFFKNNILVIRKNGYWLTKDLDKNGIKAKEIARINNSSIAILDQSKNLWVYNLETERYRFVDTGFAAMKTLTLPSTIWLWKNNTIFRLEPADILSESLQLNKFEFLKNYLVESEINKTFNVQNFYQGIAIQAGKYLFYIPDFRQNQWQIIASNVHSTTAINETIFWLDTDKNLFGSNFGNNLLKNIAQNIELTDKISYSENWKRIMLYYPTAVDSIWFNKDVINLPIRSYNKKNWISGQSCFPKTVDRVQFCVNDNQLKIYKNNNLF
jgi:hypothetical protein